MEVSLILMCSVMLTLSSVICGPSRLHENGGLDDTDVDSSPSDTNYINIYPPGQMPKDRTRPYHTLPIASLIESVRRIEIKMNSLDTKFNSITNDMLNERPSSASLEILPKLNDIHNYVARSNVQNQVLANSIQDLEEITPIVKNTDQLVEEMYDIFSRHIKGIASELNRISIKCVDDDDDEQCKSNHYSTSYRHRQVKRSNKSETTYRNLRKDTSKVTPKLNIQSCYELESRQNGIYKFGSLDEVSNKAGRFFHEQFCEFNTDGPAWTVIQRSIVSDHQENFKRSWLDYKLGFGELDNEFWFGNEFIHKLTSDDDMELRIILEDNTGHIAYAEYSTFEVASEKNNYTLTIGDYRGSITNSFRQIDNNGILSCGSTDESGWWWLNNCALPVHDMGADWKNWLGSNSLKSSRLMVRPKALRNIEYRNEEKTLKVLHQILNK